jgi:hypothetical protein
MQQPTLQSPVQDMGIVKQKPFVLVYKIEDSETNEPLARKRVLLDFSLQASSSPLIDLPNLLDFKDASDYTKLITDDKGILACTFVIKDVSRKYDGKGLTITAKIDGSPLTHQSPVFKVISKRKADPSVSERPAKKLQRIIEKLESIEQRLSKLEERQL